MRKPLSVYWVDTSSLVAMVIKKHTRFNAGQKKEFFKFCIDEPYDSGRGMPVRLFTTKNPGRNDSQRRRTAVRLLHRFNLYPPAPPMMIH